MVAASEIYMLSPEVQSAREVGAPIVALESALITHGLPYPTNIQVARKLEATIRESGAVPATIAVLGGKIQIGLGDRQLGELAETATTQKVSRRDIAAAVVAKTSGGTTVAATMYLAARHGIRVFATGGIGGVHRESPADISADLPTLADTPMIVVCAGAKAILDLPSTLEYLETAGVPVIGYQVNEFPAFYSRDSGLSTGLRLDSPEAIAEYWVTHRLLGMEGGILVANPIPLAAAIPRSEIEPMIASASTEAVRQGIHGQAVTPFLLQTVSDLTGKRSMRANEALLLNNSRLAAQIAVALSKMDAGQEVST